jgi:hypothetical protein
MWNNNCVSDNKPFANVAKGYVHKTNPSTVAAVRKSLVTIAEPLTPACVKKASYVDVGLAAANPRRCVLLGCYELRLSQFIARRS